MRVLHLDCGKEMRGGQWQVLALLQGLGAGHTLLTASDGPLMKAALARGINAQPLNMLSIATLSKQADLTHAHDARSHTWAATLSGCPLVVSRRVAFPINQSFLSRWKYGRAERYLAVSEHVKRTLVEAEVPETKISVVYDGVDIPPAPSSGDQVLAFHTGDPMKGSDLLDEAARIGGFQVRYSTNLEADLPKAAVFVYITRSEGLGSAALLAMAMGVPVVASRVGGLPEIVAEEKTGILTDNDPEAIAASVAKALANREELGRNARLAVEQRFSTRQMVDRTRDAYRQVLG
jgi:Glycosyl transferases group 1/Glycosyltransferase Family 4